MTSVCQLEEARQHLQQAINDDPYEAQYHLDMGQVLSCTCFTSTKVQMLTPEELRAACLTR
jgi:hypothetical protein